jgi:uncharacterized protein YjeT (DUF2065 family)
VSLADLLSVLALVLVLEGVLPLVAPRVWREAFRKMTEMTDGQLRFIGLASMLSGVLIIYLIK